MFYYHHDNITMVANYKMLKDDLSATNNTKKAISEPPLNLLFNLSLIARKDVWSIDLSTLLGLLLRIISSSEDKDLRIFGVAILSSSIIHRLKVESIFRLDKISMQKKRLELNQVSQHVPKLNPIEIPFRIDSTYPVSLEELIQVLEKMVTELTNRKQKKQQLGPVESFSFNEYLVKFEEILKAYEKMIFDIVSKHRQTLFKSVVAKMDTLEVVRCFIAMLSLATKTKIDLTQKEYSEDIEISIWKEQKQ